MRSDEAMQRASELFEQMPLIRRFMSLKQISVMAQGAQGEEREFFITKMLEMAERFRSMPKTYEQDGKGDSAVVYLHYFNGSMDWYITERDKEVEQQQAFGLANLGFGGELGYISIEEILEYGGELDLHWTPAPLSTVRR